METGAERLAARREWLAQAARAEAERPGRGAREVLRAHDELRRSLGRDESYLGPEDVDIVELVVAVVKNLAHGGASERAAPDGPLALELTEAQKDHALRMRAEHFRVADIAAYLGVRTAAVADYLASLEVRTPAHAIDLLKRRAA